MRGEFYRETRVNVSEIIIILPTISIIISLMFNRNE